MCRGTTLARGATPGPRPYRIHISHRVEGGRRVSSFSAKRGRWPEGPDGVWKAGLDRSRFALTVVRSDLRRSRFCASSSAKSGHFGLALSGLAELGFLVFLEIVHVEVAVGLEPVLMGFDGEGSDEATAGG